MVKCVRRLFLTHNNRLIQVLGYLYAGVLLANIGWFPTQFPSLFKGIAACMLNMFASGFAEDTKNFVKIASCVLVSILVLTMGKGKHTVRALWLIAACVG